MCTKDMNQLVYLLEGSQCMQIEKHTNESSDHPLWICKYLYENPDIVKKMYRDYLDAGSDIITTLTYQLSLDGLVKAYNISIEEASEIIHSSVGVARASWEKYKKETGSKKKQVISGSVGPYGAYLTDGSEYTGGYINRVDFETLVYFHRPRVQILLDAGVDFLSFETLPSKVEALALIQVLREFPSAKAWISFTCKEGNLTAAGEDFGKSVAECWKKCRDQSQLIAIGCNCTNPELVTNLLKSAKQEIGESVPFVAYSNSGEIYDGHGWTGQRQDLGAYLPEWLDIGVKYVGGCCRTDVQDIKRMRHILDYNNTL